ncbi:MAG TPA: hypothetical protein VKJ47_21935, partial [Candidatus Binatia bacterium]|nr:hypothetical protein [Candidatus Binatia bacterium]
MKRCTLVVSALALFTILVLTAHGQQPAPAKQPLQLADVLAWQTVRGVSLSPDGKWFGYRLAAQEGDSEVILRETQTEVEKRFPAGEAKGLLGGDVTFSEDSKWFAFRTMPPAKKNKEKDKEKDEDKTTGTAPPGASEAKDKDKGEKLVLVELPGGTRHEFEKVRRFVFSPKGTGWLALHMSPSGAPAAPAAPLTLPRPGAPADEGAADKSPGADLILRELATGQEISIGNVADFAFDKNGERLALVIEAQNQSGNGVQLRHLATSVQISLDSGKASYKGLTWTEKGDALAVLKGVDDKEYEGKLYRVLGFTDLAGKPAKVVYDPKGDSTF